MATMPSLPPLLHRCWELSLVAKPLITALSGQPCSRGSAAGAPSQVRPGKTTDPAGGIAGAMNTSGTCCRLANSIWTESASGRAAMARRGFVSQDLVHRQRRVAGLQLDLQLGITATKAFQYLGQQKVAGGDRTEHPQPFAAARRCA